MWLVGSYFCDQGLNPVPSSEIRVLTTGLPGNPLIACFTDDGTQASRVCWITSVATPYLFFSLSTLLCSQEAEGLVLGLL